MDSSRQPGYVSADLDGIAEWAWTPHTDVKGLLPVVNNQRVIHKDRS